MFNRIKELKNELDLSQTNFGKSIRRSLITIQQYESGKRKLDDSLLLLIERTYSVNPSWLREGVGEMFLEKEQSTLLDENLTREQTFAVNAIKKMGKKEVDELLKYIEDKEAAKKYRELLKKEQAR